jgi:predicted transcriptional regulator
MSFTLSNHQEAVDHLRAYHAERMAAAEAAAPTWFQAYEDAHDLLWSPKTAEVLAALAPTEYTQAYLMGRAAVLAEIRAVTGRSELANEPVTTTNTTN